MFKLSPKIFVITVVVGFSLEMLFGATYASFTSSTQVPNNTFTTGFWVTPSPPSPTGSPVVLNEFMPQPSNNQDWVEIYNLSGTTQNITGWKLADETGDFETFNTSLSAGSYLVTTQSGRLNVGGDTVILKDSSNNTVDSRHYSSSPGTDISIGRNPDGTGAWKTCSTPSAGFSNNGSC